MAEETLKNRFAQSKNYNFIAFSKDEAYQEANEQLLAKAFPCLPSPFLQIDVASGTGLVPQLVSALCEARGKIGTVIGIDPDHFAVESARKSTPSTPCCTIEFVEGKAQDMDRLLAGKVPPEGVDYVSIHDAIHEIEEEDKRSVLASIVRALKPGGIFTYNSAFTTIALEPAAIVVGRLKARAFAILDGKRNRGVKGLVTHSPEEYLQMITDAGLSVIHEARRCVSMSREAIAAISKYPRFTYGFFADLVDEDKISIEEKSEALIKALDDLGIVEIPRLWHELMAQKPL